MTREIWCKLFPEKMWPGDHCAIELMAEEIRMLRLLTDTVVTTALEETRPGTRDADELQCAHDLLVQLLLDPMMLHHALHPLQDRDWVLASLEAVCWALHHDHNPTFADNLEGLRVRLAVAGYRMERLPKMQYPKKERE